MARRGWTRGLAVGALIPMGGTVRPRAEAVAHNPPASRCAWGIAPVVHSRDGDNSVAGRQLVWTSPIRVGWGVAHNRKRPAHRQPRSQQPCSYGPVPGQPASSTSAHHQRHRPGPICLTGQTHHNPRTCHMDQPASQPTPPPTTQYYRHLHLSMNGQTRCVCSPSVAPEHTSAKTA